MTARWYAICSKPHKEEVLWRQLHAYGFEIFYPRFLAQAEHLDALKAKPYFPGYLFVKTDIDVVGISTFQWMPFAIGLVCFGGKPAYVPETLIEAIQKRTQKINLPVSELLSGMPDPDGSSSRQAARMGYEIIFDPVIPGRERVRALLKLLDEMTVSTDEDRPRL